MLTWTLVFSLWKKFILTWNQSTSRNSLNLCSVLLDFQSFTEKSVFECAFSHPVILFLSHLTKTSMDRVSMTWKLAMKWKLHVHVLQLTVSFESRSQSLQVCNYPNYSCTGLFTNPSIFSWNLPRIQILTGTSVTNHKHRLYNFMGRIGQHVHLRLLFFSLSICVRINQNWPISWGKEA